MEQREGNKTTDDVSGMLWNPGPLIHASLKRPRHDPFKTAGKVQLAKRCWLELGTALHTYNSSAWEAKEQEFQFRCREREGVKSHPGPLETLPQKKKKKPDGVGRGDGEMAQQVKASAALTG